MKNKQETGVLIINRSKNELPNYSTELSAGMDLRADLESGINSIILKPMERKLIGTGLFIKLPEGYEAQIRPRSGLAIKNGITVLNSPGTIDSDYIGEIKIILINLSDTDFQIHQGDRIAQMVVSKFEKVSWKETNNLGETERGEGGFGHTGNN